MQPSGPLHLGNYHGALKNWIALQEEYDCYYFIADWHALTTLYEQPHLIGAYSMDVAIDWLSSGVDPEKSTLFVQSRIPEHAELHLILSMIVPVPWLERNPTYKEKQVEVDGVDMSSYGFLGYPVLQTADVVLYKADYVPVGIDQAPDGRGSVNDQPASTLWYRSTFSGRVARFAISPRRRGTSGGYSTGWDW